MVDERILARRCSGMNQSTIREILKLLSRPGMISLAGGMPAPEAFPLELIGELSARVLEKYGSAALQYNPTEGFAPLREQLAEYLAGLGISVTPERILVTSGSQGLLDGIGKILINPGDQVVVESPTYLGAIQAFAPYGPGYLEVETDAQGVIPEALEAILGENRVKFVYLVPTFQNPTGRTLSLQRRRQVAEILRKYDTLLVEDDPYSALRFRGDPLPPICSLAPDHVVYTGTFSKVLAPGLRVGFCSAPDVVHKWLVLAKQGVDLHTSTFNQALAAEYLSGGHMQPQVAEIVALYSSRQQAMLAAMNKSFPGFLKWIEPDGGMFIWVEGPQGSDMEAVYHQAIKQNVAFVPGQYFYVRPDRGHNTLRLNFTTSNEASIEKAINLLGGILARELG